MGIKTPEGREWRERGWEEDGLVHQISLDFCSGYTTAELTSGHFR